MIKESQRSEPGVYGIDFSGAVDAGRKIWISRGTIEESILQIQTCNRISDFLGCGSGRDQCLKALCDFMVQERGCAFGLDFPFGLPQELIEEKSWEDFVLCFHKHYPGLKSFREGCRKASHGREIKRTTDIECKTPFSPYNLRVCNQTYYGIHDILSPLVHDSSACILPMQKALPDKTWVLEICPASTLKRLMKRKRLPPYKGSTDGHLAARVQILHVLEKSGLLLLEETVRSLAVGDSGGDALDSVVAAFATSRALLKPALLSGSSHRAYLLEGYVFC